MALSGSGLLSWVALTPGPSQSDCLPEMQPHRGGGRRADTPSRTPAEDGFSSSSSLSCLLHTTRLLLLPWPLKAERRRFSGFYCCFPQGFPRRRQPGAAAGLWLSEAGLQPPDPNLAAFSAPCCREEGAQQLLGSVFWGMTGATGRG